MDVGSADGERAGGARAPTVSSGARSRWRRWARDWGWLVGIAVAYLYVFPYFPKITSANELPRVYLVKAIADEHSFAIDRGVARWGGTADVSPSAGHQYSNKAPGSSMLAAPPYWIASRLGGPPSLATAMWIARVFAGIVPALAFLALLARFLSRYAPDPAVRRLVLVAYGLGSLAMTYSILFYSHQLGAVCVASAWIVALDVADGKRPLRAMAIAGALAGAAPLVDYQALFAAVPVAIHVTVRLGRALPRARLGRAIALATIGALVPIAILLAYHAACFGSPWRTGYNASTTFAMYHQHGFLGITALRWEALVGSLVHLDNGLVALSPWWLLALPGTWVLVRIGERGTALVGAAVAVIYVLFISSINFWRGGWGVGPRYIAAMLPFLLPAVCASLQWLADARARTRWALPALGVAAGTIVVGVVIYSLSSATFPYWPDSLHHPLYEITFRLLRDGLAAPSLGSALGVPGVAGIVPYLLVVAAVLGVALHRACGSRGAVLALATGLTVLALSRLAPHGGREPDRAYAFVRAAVLQGAASTMTAIPAR